MLPDPSIRLLLLSEDLAVPSDEGLKKFVSSLAAALHPLVELSVVSTQPSGPVESHVTIARADKLLRGHQLREHVRGFEPTHLVYVPRAGGTRNAFIRSWRLGRLWPPARTAMVILQSRGYGPLSSRIIKLARPEVVVAQGPIAARALYPIGIDALDIPSAVDLESFSPPSEGGRTEIRRRHGISSDSRLVLHVGHLKSGRNVELLGRIRRELGCECMVVGSTSTEGEAGVGRDLRAAGVTVVDEYVENIADLYRAANCYVFPVHESGNAIEMPLSILEALACGIPVVSTPFGSLPNWLAAGPAIRYASTDDDLVAGVRAVLEEVPPDPATVAATVSQFSWEALAHRLLGQICADITTLSPKTAFGSQGMPAR